MRKEEECNQKYSNDYTIPYATKIEGEGRVVHSYSSKRLKYKPWREERNK
jgi:hypothetical protein